MKNSRAAAAVTKRCLEEYLSWEAHDEDEKRDMIRKKQTSNMALVYVQHFAIRGSVFNESSKVVKTPLHQFYSLLITMTVKR